VKKEIVDPFSLMRMGPGVNGMPGKPQGEDDTRTISKCYRLNVGLFVVLAIAAMLWLNRHLQPYLVKTTLIGGTLTLWGIWKLIQSWVKWGIESAEVSLARRVLDRKATTEILVLALVVLAFLFFSTSSLYLIYEGESSGESEYTVQVTHNDHPYLEPVVVASYRRVIGQPFFLRLSMMRLKFDISVPLGFQPLEKEFGPGSSIRLRVPLDFKRKEFHLLRLIPGLKLRNTLPKPGSESQAEFCLRVKRNGEEYSIHDLRSQTVYVGADSADIAALVASEDRAAFRSLLANYLIEWEVPANMRGDIATMWETKRRFVSTPEFKAGDRIDLEVVRVGSEDTLVKDSIQLVSGEGIMSIFLEEK
jgi:hypothetical protein